ncbi:hypothetical protein AUJ14_06105 [Candidatus Micrarchaeota archaeon CG1_02_55_22]|nr:MAG: hypothetical protein AUJ14_06105 [Candidatus Micrarchaeota archaeon CG1_02_55_22]
MKAFDDIAFEWDAANQKPRGTLKLFLPLAKRNGFFVDAGCGNGRNIPALSEKASKVYAFDSSKELLKYAEKHASEKVTITRTSFEKIPLDDGVADAVFCMNAFHHLRTPAARRKALSEFRRILKPGGMLLLSVWNFDQERFDGFAKRDAFVPFTKRDGSKIKRFYHFFTAEELAKIVEEAGFSGIKNFYESNGVKCVRRGAYNLCLAAKAF